MLVSANLFTAASSNARAIKCGLDLIERREDAAVSHKKEVALLIVFENLCPDFSRNLVITN
jgi:hypothetical protein